ncbi:MAG: hypothetical protein GX921_09220 [Bacteroidales bacterium]|nr:hypothetical protein [Bacteroidales bacterium]
MTLAEIITAVRSILREPIAARWSDDDIKRYLNSGLIELANAAEKTTTKEVLITAGTSGIEITDDMLTIHAVYWELDDEFKELYPGIETLPKSKAQGLPKEYYIIDDAIKLSPVPDIDGAAKIAYVKKPASMVTDTDKPELKNADNVLIAYGAWQAFLEDGSPYTQIWEAEYAKRVMNWVSVYSDDYQRAFRTKGAW